MRIGFDAKRAYHNFTGLGNYSRTLLHGLATFYPQQEYLLFNPKPSRVKFKEACFTEKLPQTVLGKLFPAAWRSRWMTKEISATCNLYHGLSHELPQGIQQFSGKKLVTMHDLIFETYPEQYNKTDVLIYRKKFKYACSVADQVVAISEATKRDLIDYYQVEAERIHVVYQACDQRFYTRATPHQQRDLLHRYQIQNSYWLYVGSIIERKNLLSLCEALTQLSSNKPLYVIGKGGKYKQQVQTFLNENKLQHRVFFLEDNYPAAQIYQDLPALYQNAYALIYPSHKEGFGLPVIEAMASGCPVITSQNSAMAEIGDRASLLIDPKQTASIAEAMHQLETQETLRNQLVSKGIQTAADFTPEKCSTEMMNLYLAP